MLLFSALVAGSFSIGGELALKVPPTALNTVRFALAALMVLPIVLLTTGFPKGWAKATWRYPVLGGIFALYFIAMFEGLKTAPPVSASAVFTLVPIMSAVLGWVLLRQRTTLRMGFGLAVGALGAIWVIFRADMSALLAFDIGAGEAIYYGGCVAHAIYTPLVRKLNRGEPPVVFTFGTLLGGLALMAVYSWSDLWATNWMALNMWFWLGLLYVSAFATAITFVLVQYATLRLPSAKVMAHTYLVPTWVICWDVARGGNVPPLMILVGIVLSITALFILLKNEV
jgi:drug/metabolite transporter (DMT)-like permease